MALVSATTFEPGDVISVDYPTLDVRGLDGEITWSAILDDGTRRHSYGLRFLDSTVFVRARLIEQICRMDIYRRAQCDEHGRQLGLLCGVRRRACGSWQAVRCSLANTRSLLLWTQFRRPRLLPDAINLAISGHHFRKICERQVV